LCKHPRPSAVIKRPGREADHSRTSCADAKNAWSYTSISPYVLMAWCLCNWKILYYLTRIEGKEQKCPARKHNFLIRAHFGAVQDSEGTCHYANYTGSVNNDSQTVILRAVSMLLFS